MSLPNLHPLFLSCAFLALCAWYAAVIWRMVRDEPFMYLAWLMMIVAGAVALRLVSTHDYPPGLYEDDIKNLLAAWMRFRGRHPLFSAGAGLGVSMAAYAITQGTLWQILPAWWAMHLHAMACSVLSVIGCYAIARALGQRGVVALFVAACVATLPWSVLYGRSTVGGEIVWHETIVLWVVATSMLEDRCGGFLTISLGLAIALLWYDYFAGRTVSYMVVTLLPVVPRKRWFEVMLGLLGGLALYVPATWYPTEWTYRGASISGFAPLSVWALNLKHVWWAFTGPYAQGAAMSIAAAATMPVVVAAGCAGIAVAPWRVRIFLLTVFIIGVLPAVATSVVSTHRMLCSYIAVPLAAGMLLNVVSGRRTQAIAAIAFSGIVAWQGIGTFFSPDFWAPPTGGWIVQYDPQALEAQK